MLLQRQSLHPDNAMVVSILHHGLKVLGCKEYAVFAFSRELAISSPYFEAMAARDVEVLFAYEGYDDLVLTNLHLQQFDKKNLRSIESELQSSTTTDNSQIDVNGKYSTYRHVQGIYH